MDFFLVHNRNSVDVIQSSVATMEPPGCCYWVLLFFYRVFFLMYFFFYFNGDWDDSFSLSTSRLVLSSLSSSSSPSSSSGSFVSFFSFFLSFFRFFLSFSFVIFRRHHQGGDYPRHHHHHVLRLALRFRVEFPDGVVLHLSLFLFLFIRFLLFFLSGFGFLVAAGGLPRRSVGPLVEFLLFCLFVCFFFLFVVVASFVSLFFYRFVFGFGLFFCFFLWNFGSLWTLNRVVCFFSYRVLPNFT